MNHEEFYNKNNEMLREEHSLKMAHKAKLNLLQDQHMERVQQEDRYYKDCMRKEEAEYHDRNQQLMQQRRELRHQFMMGCAAEESADRKAVSILREADGTAAGILIQTLDECFALELRHLDIGLEYNYDEAMDRLVELGMFTYNIKQGQIIAAYHEEIDKALEAAGGEVLSYEWAVGECNGYGAWLYSPTRGALYGDSKYHICQVRPLLETAKIKELLKNRAV